MTFKFFRAIEKQKSRPSIRGFTVFMVLNTKNLLHQPHCNNVYGFKLNFHKIVKNIHSFYNARFIFNIDFSDDLGNSYVTQYNDMTPQFEIILDTVITLNFILIYNFQLPNFKILILNGDIDMVCNFIADARFIKQLANKRNITVSEFS